MLFGIVTRPWGVTVVIIDDLGLLPQIIAPGLMLVNQRPTVAGPELRTIWLLAGLHFPGLTPIYASIRIALIDGAQG
jgi:hypothetical protein